MAKSRLRRVPVIRYIILPTTWRYVTSIASSKNTGKSSGLDMYEALGAVETGRHFFIQIVPVSLQCIQLGEEIRNDSGDCNRFLL